MNLSEIGIIGEDEILRVFKLVENSLSLEEAFFNITNSY